VGLQLLAVLDVGQHGGGGGDPHGQDGLAQERVDEGRLAVVELAQHHDREALLLQLGQADVADVALGGGEAGRLATRPPG
jgi:hypothetical protein